MLVLIILFLTNFSFKNHNCSPVKLSKVHLAHAGLDLGLPSEQSISSLHRVNKLLETFL